MQLTSGGFKRASRAASLMRRLQLSPVFDGQTDRYRREPVTAFRRPASWVLAALLALTTSGCAPSVEDVVGVYVLHGDPQRGAVEWEVKQDGALVASLRANQHETGRWKYNASWSSPMGKLQVEMGSESYVYKIMPRGLGGPVAAQ